MSDTMMTLLDFEKIHASLSPGEVILDVRNPDEFSAARIHRTINIPVTELGNRSEELKKYSKIYIHCKRGGRAKTAYEILKGQGFTNLVCVHDAGMDLWIEKGFPVLRD